MSISEAMDSNSSSGRAVAMRERLWTERDVDQKLEALRSEVVRLSLQVGDLQRENFQMRRHFHQENGSLAVPMHDRHGYDESAAPRRSMPMSLRRTESGEERW